MIKRPLAPEAKNANVNVKGDILRWNMQWKNILEFWLSQQYYS